MILNLVLSSSLIVFFLVFGQKLSWRSVNDLSAVQSSHSRITNRFGGIAVICGMSSIFFINPWPNTSGFILLSGLPIFICGVLEDITGRVKAKIRLIGAFCSAGLAVLLLEVYIKSGDFWLLNDVIVFPIIAISITLLIASGVANAFNIIDGLNGFASGFSLIIALVLAGLCKHFGEPNLGLFCSVIAVAIIPFLVINFPFGFIFLGDAGAYTIGHVLFWSAIVLLFRHPEISSWAMLLIFFWPVSETLLSIYRRLKSKKSSGAPDNFHFHHIIKKLIELTFEEGSRFNTWANPLSTLVLIPLSSIPIAIGIFVLQNNNLAIIFYILLLGCYLGLYIFLIRLVREKAIKVGNCELVDSLNFIFTPRSE